jgi:hypothetical protein
MFVLEQVADDKEAEEVSKSLKPGSAEAAAAAAAAAKQADSPEMAAMLAIDSTRAHTASIRVQVRSEQGSSFLGSIAGTAGDKGQGL